MLPVSIQVAPEVTDLLGRPLVEEILRDAPTGYCCAICAGPGRVLPDSAVAVLVTVARGGDTFIVGFAHPHCSPSGVITTDSLAGLSVMLSGAAWLRPPGTQPAPVLLLAPNLRIMHVTAGGELQDRFLSAMLDRGFTPVTSVHEPLPATAELTATLSGRRVRVADKAGTVLFAGIAGLTRAWVRAAREHREVGVVLAYGLDLHDPSRDHAADLARVIRAGRAVGASVATRAHRWVRA